MPVLTTATLAVLYPFLIELAKKGAEKIIETISECIATAKCLPVKEKFTFGFIV